jgi:hypothetical protein
MRNREAKPKLTAYTSSLYTLRYKKTRQALRVNDVHLWAEIQYVLPTAVLFLKVKP